MAFPQERAWPLTPRCPYGTLDLMVLKTLAALGPLHGYGIARRIEQVAQGALNLNQGTIYPALLRLEQKGWIGSDWGMSENNRRARFYRITAAGRKQLAAEEQLWARTVLLVAGCWSTSRDGASRDSSRALDLLLGGPPRPRARLGGASAPGALLTDEGSSPAA